MENDNISDNSTNTTDSENIGSVEPNNEEENNSYNIPIININPFVQNSYQGLTNNLNVLSQFGYFQNNSLYHQNQIVNNPNNYIASLFYPLINSSLNINLQNNNQPNNDQLNNDSNQEDYIDDNQENIDIHEEHEDEQNEDDHNEDDHNEDEQNEHNFPYNFDPFMIESNMIIQNPNYENEINNKIIEVMNDASNMLFTSSEELINIINMSYLTNLQYSDGLSNIIKYTIRTSFRDTPQYEIKEVVAAILTYSLSDINVVFNENYDLIYNIIQQELKRIFSRSYVITLLANVFNNNVNNPQMENVKLTIKPEIIENIPKKKFKDHDEKIKDMNSKCTICQVGFDNDDETRILPCEHTYHVDCIDNWLTNYNYMCPCCREPAGEHFANCDNLS
jgi:hypothetical protein